MGNMENTIVNIGRLREKNKWVYNAHSQLSLQIEKKLEGSKFDVVRIGDLVKEISDGLHGIRNYVDDGIVMLAVGNITEAGLDLSTKRMVTFEEHEQLGRSQVQYGDMLVTLTGRLGTALIYESNEPANLSAHVARVKVDPELVNPNYLTAYLNSMVGKQLVDEFSIGSIYAHINVNKLQNVRVILPPRPIQDRIAAVMQDAYTRRREKLAEAEGLLGGIEEYVLEELGISLSQFQTKQRVIKPISLIAGGRFDFEAVVAMQSFNFNGIEATELRQLGKHITERITPAVDIPDEDVNYISLGNIASMTGILAEFSPVKGSSVLSSSTKFKKGDILFGRMRPYLNKVWIAEFDGVCTGEAVVFRPNLQKVNTTFLHTLLLSQITLQQVVPLQSGTSLPRVSPSNILNIKLPIPKDVHRQEEISQEITRRRTQAAQLRREAESVVAEAKARVERLILGEETP